MTKCHQIRLQVARYSFGMDCRMGISKWAQVFSINTLEGGAVTFGLRPLRHYSPNGGSMREARKLTYRTGLKRRLNCGELFIHWLMTNINEQVCHCYSFVLWAQAVPKLLTCTMVSVLIVRPKLSIYREFCRRHPLVCCNPSNMMELRASPHYNAIAWPALFYSQSNSMLILKVFFSPN
jgi:hypothetical protein